MFVANTIIENLLQAKKAQAAMVLDALFAADLNLWPSMDISTILHYLGASGIPIGESIVRRGLFDLVQIGLLGTRKIMNRAKGRPAWNYQIKKVPQMAEILGVKLHRDENADSVPKAAFKSTRAYRGGKHYSFLLRLGTSYLSRKTLGKRLGVGGRSTFNYEKGLGVQVTQRIESTPLSKADIESAPLKRPNANVYLLVEFERELTEDEFKIKYADRDQSTAIFWRRTTTDKKYMPYTQFILRRELERGNRVFKVKQVTNEYKVA